MSLTYLRLFLPLIYLIFHKTRKVNNVYSNFRLLTNLSLELDELTAQYWANMAKSDLFVAIHRTENYNKAKNVILFLGDGMGVSTIAPSRILKGQLRNNSGEDTQLAFEDFPNTCLIKVSPLLSDKNPIF